MNKKYLDWLYKELPELVGKEIIPEQSAEQIRQYYGDIKSTGKKPLLLIVFGVLGALLIGLGIILLLAHNWEQFSRSLRTALSLAPLVIAIIIAGWVLWKREESNGLKEASATFLALMIGASQALICQTYNIGGSSADFIITWMLLSLPLVYLMDATIPAVIYLIGITSWAGCFWDDQGRALLFWPLAAAVVPHFIRILKKDLYAVRATILALVLAICVCVGAAFTFGRHWPGSWVMLYSGLFCIFYLLSAIEFEGISTIWQQVFNSLSRKAIIIFSLVLTYRGIWSGIQKGGDLAATVPSQVLFADYLGVLLVIITAVALCAGAVLCKEGENILFGSLSVVAAVAYAFSFAGDILPTALFNLYVLIISLYLIITGIRIFRLGTVNTGLLIMGVLIISRLFDSNISFTIKGLVFILFGAGFLLTNKILLGRKGGAN